MTNAHAILLGACPVAGYSCSGIARPYNLRALASKFSLLLDLQVIPTLVVLFLEGGPPRLSKIVTVAYSKISRNSSMLLI